MIDRRQFVRLTAMLAAAPALARPPTPLDLKAAVVAAEKRTGGRIGLTVHDTATGRRFAWRGDARFPMASTFKALLAAAILERIDAGKDRLDRAVAVAKADMVGNSPLSAKHVGGTATVGELAEAMVIYSDNTATNLLLPAVGGPAGFTAFLRRIGDPVTRLDRNEPAMSTATPGDPRDTTSPNAIAASFERVLLGNLLTPASRQQLTSWLVANTTGDTRLRAGLPSDWKIGDKTGTGDHGTVNDIAIVWPSRTLPGPVFIASFVNGGTAPADLLYRAHADLARAVAAAL